MLESQEILEVLDEDGSPTGKTMSRDEIHASGAWHRVAYIILFRKEKGLEFLVQKRSITKKANPGKWDVHLGGHVKFGEDIKEAARAELKDEVGLEFPEEKFLFDSTRKSEGSHKVFASTYFVNFHGEPEDLKFNDGEVETVRWIKPQDIFSEMEKFPESWARKKDAIERAIAFIENQKSV